MMKMKIKTIKKKIRMKLKIENYVNLKNWKKKMIYFKINQEI